MRRTTCLALILVGCLLTSGCSQGSRLRPFAKKDKVEKTGTAAKSKAGSSTNREAEFDVAVMHEKDGQYHKARGEFEALVKAEPDNARFQHRLGVVCMQLGDTEKGLEHLRLAEVNSEGNSEILNDLGYACMMAGRFDLAKEVLLTAIEANPNDRRAINNLGVAYGFGGDFDQAFSTFRRIMSEADALANLGYTAAQSGRMEFATECYSKALTLNPDQQQAAEALAQIADLDRVIEQRKSIARVTAESKQTREQDVIQASGTSSPRKR